MVKNISRRTFVKGTVAATGLAAISSGYDIIHPKGTFASEKSPATYGFTYCDNCNTVPKCGLTATIKEGKIVRIESKENYPNSPICAKGVATIQELYDPERLLHPIMRTAPKGSTDPKWERISWDQAYSIIAEKLNGVKQRYGAEKVMFYTGDPKEARPIIQRLANVFGSPTYGNESSTCAMGPQTSARLVLGRPMLGADPGPKTKSCLIWSNNAAWSLPAQFGRLCDAKRNGTKFIVVDPRVTPTVSAVADIHLQLRPGTDGALALGMAHIMLRDGLYDKEFAESWIHGFDEFANYVKEFTPEKVAEITWVPKERIEAAVQLYVKESPGTWISSASATTHQRNGGHAQRAILAIVALAGYVDVEGGLEMNSGLPFDGFAGNPTFSGVPDLYPEIRHKRPDLNDFPVWAHFNQEMQVNMFPEYVDQGKIKAMYMIGGNAMMWPQPAVYQKALEKLEFSVAADYYLRPWTHNYMDMVLPAAMTYERMAPFAIFGRKIYLREPLVEPAGEARADWRICCEIGAALGYKEEFFNGSEEEALEEVLRQTKLGITLKDLRNNPDGLTIPPTEPNTFKRYKSGKLRPDGLPGFQTPTGKLELVSEVCRMYNIEPLPIYEEFDDSPISNPDLAKKFPLILNTGSRLPFYTHSKLRNLPWLNQFMPEPVVRLNPIDAKERGLKDGDKVKLATKLGELNFVLEVTNIVLPGVIDVYHGWHQADVNTLIERKFDPITGFPPYKVGLCQVSKA